MQLTQTQLSILLSRSIKLAAEAHVGCLDKGGMPYILHALTVMNGIDEEDFITRMAAVLHDVVEDTHFTYETISAIGVPKEVIDILHLVTHKAEVSYCDYIIGIATCPKATLIKLEDIKHNSNVLRLRGCSVKDLQRMHKYHNSFLYLTGKQTREAYIDSFK